MDELTKQKAKRLNEVYKYLYAFSGVTSKLTLPRSSGCNELVCLLPSMVARQI